MIKVALADDHAILRKGVAEILSKFDDLTVCMEAANGKELMKKLADSAELPDVCVVDINMPEMNGYDTTAAIKKEWPHVRVLALSMYDTELNIIRMLRSGASGYVLKDSDPQQLHVAINKVHKDGFYCSELVTGRMLNVLHNDDKDPEDISERELQFLEYCVTELTYNEIAEKMFLSPRTIDGYRESLFRKLDLSTRTGLVMYAIKAGIVTV